MPLHGTDRESRRIAAHLNHLLAGMTAHGLGRMSQEASQAGRLVWLAVFACALLGVSQHTASLVRLYLSYPVSSTVRQEVNGFEFPDVTVCDSMLKKFFLYDASHFDRGRDRSYARYSQAVQTLLAYQLGWETKSFIKAAYTASGHKFNMSDVSARVQDFVLFCEYDQRACNFSNFTLYYDDQYGNCYTFQPDQRRLGKAGAATGLVLVLYPPSVDANFDEDRIMKTVTGLENKGFQVTVHQGDTRPDPHEFSVTAPVGMRTDLALTQTKVRLADTTTRPCQPARRRRYWNSFLGNHQVYLDRLYDCVETEQKLHLHEACNCTIEGLVPVEETALLRADYCHDVLNMRNQQARQQLERIADMITKMWSSASKQARLKFAANISAHIGRHVVAEMPEVATRLTRAECANSYTPRQHLSECENECQYTDYSSSISVAEWPDRSFASRGSLIRVKKLGSLLAEYIQLVAKYRPPAALATSLVRSRLNLSGCREDDFPNYEETSLGNTTCRQLQEFVSNTLVQVRVYPKTLTSRLLLEECSYELEKLFSDIGGILGLWMGASVVTVFEFFELLAHLLLFGTAYLGSLWQQQLRGSRQRLRSRQIGETDGTGAGSDGGCGGVATGSGATDGNDCLLAGADNTAAAVAATPASPNVGTRREMLLIQLSSETHL